MGCVDSSLVRLIILAGVWPLGCTALTGAMSVNHTRHFNMVLAMVVLPESMYRVVLAPEIHCDSRVNRCCVPCTPFSYVNMLSIEGMFVAIFVVEGQVLQFVSACPMLERQFSLLSCFLSAQDPMAGNV